MSAPIVEICGTRVRVSHNNRTDETGFSTEEFAQLYADVVASNIYANIITVEYFGQFY